MRVARREFRLAVPGQFLQRPKVDPGAPAEGEVAVPQRVEVGVLRAVRPLDGVGDPGRFQVDAEHGGGDAVAGPRPAPDRLVRGLAVEVVAERGGDVGGERLHLRAAVLREPGRERHAGRGAGQVEVGRGQTGQRGGAEAGAGGGQVEEVAVVPGQPPERLRAVAGRREETAELVGGQFAARPPHVHGRVHEGEGFERVRADPPRPHEPAEEAANRPDVVVDRRRAAPLRLVPHQRLDGRPGEPTRLAVAGRGQAVPLHGRGDRPDRHAEQLRDVGRLEGVAGRDPNRLGVPATPAQPVGGAAGVGVEGEHEAAPQEEGVNAAERVANMLSGVALGFQVGGVVLQVLSQRPAQVLLGGVDQPDAHPSGLALRLGGQLLRRLEVVEALDAVHGAVRVADVEVPALRGAEVLRAVL
ncbi:MAG: hypothetical protein U0797_06765 [Gemmataceae bacterium]